MQEPQLEDRLRGLILSNGGADPPLPVPSAEGPQRNTKKRPNQAQRRQMNAQLTIPVDVRQTSAPVRDTRPAGNFSQSGSWSQHGSHHHDSNQRSYRGRGHYMQGPVAPQQQRFQASPRGDPYRGLHNPQGQDWRSQQALDQRSPRGSHSTPSNDSSSRGRGSQHGYHSQAQNRQYFVKPEDLANQVALLDWMCRQVHAGAEIEPGEIVEKENFRIHVEKICQEAVRKHEVEMNQRNDFRPETVELKCFGSLMSGFATKAADMDLGIVSPMSTTSPEDTESPIPRVIEKALLDAGFGARLLTRTRVPIIKLCERPNTSLYNALLENRRKWEDGNVDDDQDVDEDIPEPHDEEPEPHIEPQTLTETVIPAPQSTNRGTTSTTSKSRVSERSSEGKNWTLRQSQNQSLVSYCSQAKKLLRQLNGRDLTHSNSVDFSPSDYELLDAVSRAFVSGLHDKTLQQRVQGLPSYTNTGPAPCTLMGVSKTVEGESLVMLYENKPFTGENTRKEGQSKAILHAWHGLHNKPGVSQNPLAFNKELQHSVETLRQIPAVQLMQLSQDQHEPASLYHTRTLRILNDLSGPGGPTQDMTDLALASYITGIHDTHTREQVQAFASTHNASLQAVALKHKVLQLVGEYQKALDQGLYAAQDAPAVRAYMDLLLQEDPHVDHVQPADSGALVVKPLSAELVPLFEKVRQLPDPSKLAPNQPRDKYNDKLEFPKTDIGVQCDINFSAHLALQNTLLLRCYSRTDPRVRPMVLFVKHWARVRGINTSYRGTLSSYGYVLMVLHYLVNVVEPFVCPNLQLLAPPTPDLPAEALEGLTTCKGYNVSFWRDEEAIAALASSNRLNQNGDSLGTLLRGFFEYFAQSNKMSTANKRGFDWGRDVLSLRTQNGLLTKQEKGWTGAKTVRQPQSGLLHAPDDHQQAHDSPRPDTAGDTESAAADIPPTEPHTAVKPVEFKEVRNRYLFAIEDPFEIEHNVARTVTHNGIVSIRDEFRRAWRIIKSASRGVTAQPPVEDLLEDVNAKKEAEGNKAFVALLHEIHGLV